MADNNKKLDSRSLLSDEIKYLVPYFICMFLSIAFLEANLIVITNFIDHMVTGSQGVKVSVYVAPIIIAFFFSALFLGIKERIKIAIIRNISNKLTTAAMQSILSSDLYENDINDIKKATANIIEDTRAITSYYISKNNLQFFELIIIILTAFFSTFFMYGLGGLILLVITPFFITLERIFIVLSRKSKERYHNSLDKKQKLFDDTIDSIVRIKLCNGKNKVLKSLSEIDEEYSNTYKERSMYKHFSTSILLVATIGIALSLAYGLGVAFDFSNLSIGKLVYITMITPTYFILIHIAMKSHVNRNDVSKEETELYNIINMKEEERNEPIKELDDIYSISFNNVSYSYLNSDEKDNLLNSLDFDIKKGEAIGIYSSNDEEKDAIYESIIRIRRNKSGHISINNNYIEKINLDYLRSIITPVSNYFENMEGTISEIISYPYPYDDYKYNEALNKSGLSELVNGLSDKGNTYIDKSIIIENNYDRMLEFEEDSFEARLALANAIYQDTKIYVIKDFCSGYGKELEKRSQEVLFSLKGKMMIVLTKNIELLKDCDKILIIKDGKVLEYGNKEDLVNNKNSYYNSLIK